MGPLWRNKHHFTAWNFSLNLYSYLLTNKSYWIQWNLSPCIFLSDCRPQAWPYLNTAPTAHWHASGTTTVSLSLSRQCHSLPKYGGSALSSNITQLWKLWPSTYPWNDIQMLVLRWCDSPHPSIPLPVAREVTLGWTEQNRGSGQE